MVDAPHTGATHVEVSQGAKEATINAMIDRHAAFIADFRSFVISGDVTPTTTSPDFEWFTATRFVLTGAHATTFAFNVPTGTTRRKIFVIDNQTAAACTVQVVGGGGVKVTVPPDEIRHLYSDGTDIFLSETRSILAVRDPVRVVSITNGILATDFENGDTLDGVVLATGDRILLAGQDTGSENGIRIVQASGAPVRADDYKDGSQLIQGQLIPVIEGTADSNTLYMLTSAGPYTIDTTTLTFIKAAGGGGVKVKDEGSQVIEAASAMNFVGAGVTVTDAGGNEATVTITGGSGGSAATVDVQAFSGARVRKTTNQSINNGIQTAITWDAEVFDIGGWHDNATNNARLTVPAGVNKVVVTANAKFASNATGDRYLIITKNGATQEGAPITRVPAVATNDFINVSTGPVDVVAGDYFEAEAFQNSGGVLNVDTDANSSFSIMAVDAAIPSALPEGALVRSTSTQSLTTGVWTAINFQAEERDTGTIHDNVTNNTRLTVPVGVNVVRLNGNVRFAVNATGLRGLRITKNGVEFNGGPTNIRLTGNTNDKVNVSTGDISVTAGDYFELEAFQSSGGALNVDNDKTTWFTMQIVRGPAIVSPDAGLDGVIAAKLLHVRDKKATTTNGGGVVTAATYQTRVLNDIVINEIPGATLASDQITLGAGEYFAMISGAGLDVGRTRVRLRDVTNNVDLVLGSNSFNNDTSGTPDQTNARGAGRFTLSDQVTMELQQYFQVDPAQAFDLGAAMNDGLDEIYGEVYIWRLDKSTRAGVKFALVTIAANQSTSTGVWDVTNWEAVVSDTNGFFNIGSQPTRLTVPTGVTRVRVSANCVFAASTAGTNRGLRITKNGAIFEGMPVYIDDPTSAGRARINVNSGVLAVSPGDYFEMQTFQDSGAGLNIEDFENGVWFAIEAVEGPAIVTQTVSALKSFRGCLLNHSTTQSITSATETNLIFDTEQFDTDSFHDTVTNNSRITIPSGVTRVRLTATVDWATGTTGDRDIRFYKNGADFVGGTKDKIAAATGQDFLEITSPPLSVKDGDFFQVRVTHSQGTALNVNGGNWTTFACEVLEEIRELATPRGALVTKSVNQSHGTTGTWIAVTFDEETVDSDAIHDNVTNNTRLTVPAGVAFVRIFANVKFASNDTGQRGIKITKNGAEFEEMPITFNVAGASTTEHLNISSGLLPVNPGDYFELEAFQSSGGALNIDQANGTWFSMEIVERMLPPAITAPGIFECTHSVSSGNSGGTSVNAIFNVRKFNTEFSGNNIAGASLDKVTNVGRITLPAGTYDVEAWSAVRDSNQHLLRLRNITGAADLLIGVADDVSGTAGHGGVSHLNGRIILTGITDVELHHYTKVGLVTVGMGQDAGSGINNVFGYIRFTEVT